MENLLTTAGTQYVYDAEGRRVAKGSIASWPASGATCATPTAANGFNLTSTYLRGSSGNLDAEMLSNGTSQPIGWNSNVFLGSNLLATYNYRTASIPQVPNLYFSFNDWLGTKRLLVNAAGQMIQHWGSDPFSDYLTPSSGTGPDPSEQHYTGKERDTESGNDYFGARYYASSMGRFMSPDWSAKEDPVPYALMDDPQSLNLYSYVRNNPLSRTDPDGHCPECAWVEDFIESGQAEEDVDVAIAAGSALFTAIGSALHSDQIGPTPLGALQVLSFSPKVKKDAAGAADNTCQICGVKTVPAKKSAKGVTPPANEGQTDHIKPKSKGGNR